MDEDLIVDMDTTPLTDDGERVSSSGVMPEEETEDDSEKDAKEGEDDDEAPAADEI